MIRLLYKSEICRICKQKAKVLFFFFNFFLFFSKIDLGGYLARHQTPIRFLLNHFQICHNLVLLVFQNDVYPSQSNNPMSILLQFNWMHLDKTNEHENIHQYSTCSVVYACLKISFEEDLKMYLLKFICICGKEQNFNQSFNSHREAKPRFCCCKRCKLP